MEKRPGGVVRPDPLGEPHAIQAAISFWDRDAVSPFVQADTSASKNQFVSPAFHAAASRRLSRQDVRRRAVAVGLARDPSPPGRPCPGCGHALEDGGREDRTQKAGHDFPDERLKTRFEKPGPQDRRLGCGGFSGLARDDGGLSLKSAHRREHGACRTPTAEATQWRCGTAPRRLSCVCSRDTCANKHVRRSRERVSPRLCR